MSAQDIRNEILRIDDEIYDIRTGDTQIPWNERAEEIRALRNTQDTLREQLKDTCTAKDTLI